MLFYFKLNWVCLLLFLTFPKIANGQVNQDIEKIIKQAIDIYYNEPDSALSLLNHNKTMILAVGNPEQIIDMYITYFRLYYYVKKNSAEAKISLKKAEKISKDNQDFKLSIIYQNLGRYYHRAETKLDSSLYYHFKATEIEKMKENNYNLNHNYSDLADLYLTLQDLEKAITYIEKALEIVRGSGKRKDYGYTLHTAIKLYQMSGDSVKLDLAQKEYQEFKMQGKTASVDVHSNTSFMSNESERTEKFKQEITKNDSLSNTTRSLIYRLKLADEYLNKIKYKDAIEVLLSGLPILDDTSTLFQHNFHSKLKEAFFYDKQFEKAYMHSEIVASLNEKILNEQKLLIIEDLKARYEKLENEKLIGDLQKEKKLATRNNYILVLLLLLSIVVLLSLIGINRIIKKNLKILEEKNSIITEMLKEKDFLIKEIHHRVKNNLQVISSLLQMQARHINEPTAQEALIEGEARVRSMAIIHQHLYSGSQHNKVNLSAYIDNLVDNLKHSYNNKNKKIEIHKDIQEIELDITEIIPLGLIINELLVNSYKYAFENIEIGKIGIAVNMVNGKINVLVSDDGIGLDPKFTKEGFGTRLIQTFAKKLQAKYDVHSSPNNGTQIKIEFYTPVLLKKDKNVA